MLTWAETVAAAAGFARAELATTLAGVPFCAACGWSELTSLMTSGVPMLKMGKRLTPQQNSTGNRRIAA